jgi:hypothetical protein
MAFTVFKLPLLLASFPLTADALPLAMIPLISVLADL